MASLPSLRPRRRLALPFVLVSFPLLWFVMRETGVSGVGRPVTEVLPQVVGSTVAALVVSYAVAVLVDTAVDLDPESVPPRGRPLVEPSDGALATFGALSLALVAYVLGSSVVEFPMWFETLASAVGVVVGWPLFLAVLLTYAVGNAVPALQGAFAFEAGLVVLGVALSAAWLFVLSDWLARRVLPGSAARTGP